MSMENPLATDLLQALGTATGLQLLDQRERIAFRDEGSRVGEIDLEAHVRMPDGQELVLAIEFKRSAYPRDVRLAVEQLQAYQQSLAAVRPLLPVLPLVAAEHLSDGSRDQLRHAGVNYFDSTGTLFFKHGTWLVDIERASKSARTRRIGSIFSGAREQVVHAMLRHWSRTRGDAYVSGAELAQLAATSAYTVSKTMQEMERQDWVQTQGSGPTQRRRLCEPAALLDAWAEAWNRRSEERSRWYGYAPEGIVRPITDGLADRAGWALTGAAAANMLVPHLSRVDRATFIIPPHRSEDWADELELKRAEQGANVVFIERDGAALLFVDESRDRPGLRLASPFVQYLDLLDGVGRNKELATELRHRILRIDHRHGD